MAFLVSLMSLFFVVKVFSVDSNSGDCKDCFYLYVDGLGSLTIPNTYSPYLLEGLKGSYLFREYLPNNKVFASHIEIGVYDIDAAIERYKRDIEELSSESLYAKVNFDGAGAVRGINHTRHTISYSGSEGLKFYSCIIYSDELYINYDGRDSGLCDNFLFQVIELNE